MKSPRAAPPISELAVTRHSRLNGPDSTIEKCPMIAVTLPWFTAARRRSAAHCVCSWRGRTRS